MNNIFLIHNYNSKVETLNQCCYTTSFQKGLQSTSSLMQRSSQISLTCRKKENWTTKGILFSNCPRDVKNKKKRFMLSELQKQMFFYFSGILKPECIQNITCTLTTYQITCEIQVVLQQVHEQFVFTEKITFNFQNRWHTYCLHSYNNFHPYFSIE